MSNIIDIGNPKANMYGCLPCPKCSSIYRWPAQQGTIQCDDCGYVEKGTKPMTPDELHDFIGHMFEQLDIYGEELNEWEEEFIASIREQFKQNGSLSVRQREILERIYTNRT